jgi:hypothetical protein
MGVAILLAGAVATPFALAKLYTGRHPENAVATALAEQPLVAFLGVCTAAAGLAMLVWAPRLVAGRRWFNPVWALRNRPAECVLLAVSCAAALGVLEVASRVLYARAHGFPLNHSIEELIYPPLLEQFQQQPYSPDNLNVLLLGGSVMWIAGRAHEIEHAFDPPARVYNMAQNAHSSLDSLNKFEWLLQHGYKFDCVIFYHAINEVRANNAPPDVFSPDYDHYSFYRLTNTVFQGKRPWLRAMLRSSLFFRGYRVWETLRETRAFGRRYLHMAFPREDWLPYGADVRSAESFRGNLARIAALAKENQAALIVPLFACNPMLDEQANAGRMTEWGLAGNLAKGIQAHNAVIQSMSSQFIYIDDTRRLMIENNFVDPCHFTEQAQAQFIEILKQALRQAAKTAPK